MVQSLVLMVFVLFLVVRSYSWFVPVDFELENLDFELENLDFELEFVVFDH